MRTKTRCSIWTEWATRFRVWTCFWVGLPLQDIKISCSRLWHVVTSPLDFTTRHTC